MLVAFTLNSWPQTSKWALSVASSHCSPLQQRALKRSWLQLLPFPPLPFSLEATLIRLSFSSLLWACYLSYQLSAQKHLIGLIIPSCLKHLLYTAPKTRHAHVSPRSSLATPLSSPLLELPLFPTFPRVQSSSHFYQCSFSGQTHPISWL